MQKVYMREPKLTPSAPRLDDERILHFSLQEALPSTHTLALNLAFGTLSYISCVGDRPLLLMQEQFTNSEMSVLLPLLEAFPYYCPYEIMFAHFYNGKVNDKLVARSRQHLQAAAEEGLWDQEMRPVRSALSRTRLKLRPFGIEVSSILATGYLLMISNRMPHLESPEETSNVRELIQKTSSIVAIS
jgi:hypothetical protein